MRNRNWRLWTAAALGLALCASFTYGGKGGGGGKPGGGGGGGGGIADSEVSILYRNTLDSTLYKGDDGGRVEQALALEVYGSASFGPAGATRLAFVTDVDGLGVYVTDDFSGAGRTRVVDLSSGGFTGFPELVAPAWSNGDAPNGEEMIAFVEQRAGSSVRYQLYVTTLSGEVTQLTSDDESVFHPSWNPVTNGQVVVAGPTRLRLLDLAADSGGGLVVEAEVDLLAGTSLEGVRVQYPSFSPDGGRIAFNALTKDDGASGLFDVWVYDVATGELTNLTATSVGPHDAHHPCIRKDGRVMFSYPDGKYLVLHVVDADGSDPRVYGNTKRAHDQRLVVSRR